MDHRRAGHGANAHRVAALHAVHAARDGGGCQRSVCRARRADSRRVRPREPLGLGRPVAGEGLVPAPARGREPYAAYGPIEGIRAATVPGASSSSRAVSWPPRSGTGRSPAPGLPRRCASTRGSRGWGSRPITARSRTRWTGCARPCTCTGAAIAVRRRSLGCTTSDDRHVGSSCCTSTVRGTRCRRPGPRSWPVTVRWGA